MRCEPYLVAEPLEQGVHPTHPGDAVILERPLHVRQRARVRDQHVARAEPVEAEQVHREGEDVIHRQDGQGDFLALPEPGGKLDRLLHVHDQVRVRQHGALGDAGGSPGILEAGDIVGPDGLVIAVDLHLGRCTAGASDGQRVGQADMGERDRPDRAVPVSLDEPDDPARQRRDEFRDAGDDDARDRPAPGRGRNLVGEEVDDDQRLRLGILELPRHLVGGVERIHVDQHATRLQHPEGRHREGEPVRHLHGHAVALYEARDLAQIDRERVRHLVHLREAQRAVHAVRQADGEGGGVAIGLGDRADEIRNGPVGRFLNLGADSWPVERRPRPIFKCQFAPRLGQAQCSRHRGPVGDR